MAGNERRRQKSLAKKAAKRKDRQKAGRLASGVGSGGGVGLRTAARWPLREALLSQSWSEVGELTQILVARQSGDAVAAAGFIVDLGCLGVKDALYRVFESEWEYAEFREMYSRMQPMEPSDLDLVAKIIREGLAYARGLGFSPNADYRKAALLLDGANPDACETPVPVGDHEGHPFFIPGPHDNPDRVIRQLERAVGPGNYDFARGLEPVALADDLVDDWDEDDGEWDEDDNELDEDEDTLDDDDGVLEEGREAPPSPLSRLFHRRGK